MNCLFHNKNDFNGKDKLCLRINNVTNYLSVHRNDVKEGTIEMNFIMRNLFNVKIDDYIETKEIIEESIIVKNLEINIYVKNITENILSIHEEEIISLIHDNFKNHHFYINQELLVKYNDNILIIIVKNGNGKIIPNITNIKIKCDDTKLNIIGSKLLKRELFKEDYKFEDIGIGGLDNNMIEIFRNVC